MPMVDYGREINDFPTKAYLNDINNGTIEEKGILYLFSFLSIPLMETLTLKLFA